ncbi:MAG TPA: hypothetical protein VNF07_02335 [Acidimicrobiales bacterium]|nr:hypothetical protein [Acidimicrobiales bacterium]
MPPMQFCTTSSRRYLPYAKALGATIRRHMPESTLWILLTDDHHHEVDPASDPSRLLWNEELAFGDDELHRLFLIHADDYHLAIKPFLIHHVLHESGGPVMFIDSDIHLYGSLAHVGELIEEHGIVLTPHALTPYPLDDCGPDDTTILSAGTFNAGMIGVGEKGIGLIDFLESRLRRECYVDPARHRVSEQRWLDFAPSFFPLHVLRDTGVNVAYWNLHERPLTLRDGVIHAGEAPLRSYHFSGYDFANPGVLSRHAGPRARVTLAEQPIVAELCAGYREAILACGYESAQQIPVDFAELPGGIPVDPTLRAVFRAAVIGAEKQGLGYPPDPYDLAVRPLFQKWAELTYAAAKLPVPAWALQEGVPAAAPSGRGEVTEELLRRLASTSSAAIGNLDQRVAELERLLARLAEAS